ncbi:MAG: 50S ribosomal protein L20 [Candidatus Riflebacteria bacterium]|nr:50S ribosomal protein L20 [Candidatus Riflebacteria bacterium]
MPRSKSSSNSRKKEKKLYQLSKGYWAGHRNIKKVVKETVVKAFKHAYNDRKDKKQNFRSLWILRINSACRLNDISYSKFMNGLKKAGVNLNRKVLADIAVKDPDGFKSIVQVAKTHVQNQTSAAN